jgi:hypothetical protein
MNPIQMVDTVTQYRKIKAEIDENWAITQSQPDIEADLSEELNDVYQEYDFEYIKLLNLINF